MPSGHGVPFRFPSSPDIGDGLTTAGRSLVLACRDLGIIIDLSHLNEKGFWDVTKLGDAPLVATHCCAHALAPSSRNLTDDQLRAIRDSDGVVGLNFHVGDLRAEGGFSREQPIARMIQQHRPHGRNHGRATRRTRLGLRRRDHAVGAPRCV